MIREGWEVEHNGPMPVIVISQHANFSPAPWLVDERSNETQQSSDYEKFFAILRKDLGIVHE